MFVIKYRWVFYIISILLVVVSAVSLARFGLQLGTDFRGGTILEINYATSTRPTVEAVKSKLTPLSLTDLSVQPAGTSGLLLRAETISEPQHQALLTALRSFGNATETRFSSVGPSLGTELARKGIVAIIVSVIFIILFIAFAFRSVSRPVSSWKYGVTAIIALIHDVTIPAGVFSLLGHFRGVEVDALFLTALLTGFALSVNDTIVVFDRIRENLKRHSGEPFPQVVGQSLTETFGRSIRTSLTVVLALLALYFWGGESTRYFSLALIISMIVGTYSSIFIASPLLVSWNKNVDGKKK